MSKLNEYDDQIREMASRGMSDVDIANALPVEVTHHGVHYYRSTRGIQGRKPGAVSKLDDNRDEVTRLYVEEKLSDQVIADRFDVTAEAVRRARIRWGIATDKNKSTGRYSREAQFEKVKDQLPAAWERSKRWHSRQQRMVGSATRVGQEFGVGASTAAKWLSRVGLGETKSAHGENASLLAVQLFDTGLSVPGVAREMKIPEDTVRHWISKCRDLSNPHARRSYEEKIAFRQAISNGKGGSVAGRGQFNYNGTRLDSSWEVRFAKNLDRLGIAWQGWDRDQNGTVEIPGDISGYYAPDFLVGEIAVEVKGIYDATAALKVSAWRRQRGELAMVMKDELFELEAATTAEEVLASLQAFCYLDPPTERAYWS